VSDTEKYVLRLYVTGMTSRSLRAIATVRAVCDRHLAGRHELEIVDVYQQPGRISDDQIVAIPTLVKYQPAPLRRIIGDMSNRQRLLDGLGLVREAEAT
jgi:circadian clock protein KaiB